jgi:hypothetical protein
MLSFAGNGRQHALSCSLSPLSPVSLCLSLWPSLRVCEHCKAVQCGHEYEYEFYRFQSMDQVVFLGKPYPRYRLFGLGTPKL